MELEDIKKIGPKAAEELRKEGITPEKLSIMRADEVKAILGCSLKVAKEIINDAKEKASPLQLLTGKEILDYRKKVRKFIPTGSIQFDRILGGGVSTDAVTAIKGKYGAGKTQLGHMLAVMCKKYLNGATAWIQTEPMSFIPERILEIAKARGIEIDLENDILVVPAKLITTPVPQFRAYELIEKKIKDGMNIKLIVVDSYIAKFRTAYTGRPMLPDRSQELGRHFNYLQYLAAKYNLAVYLTFQVMGVPDAGQQLGTIKIEATRDKVAGGGMVEHSPTYWVALAHISKEGAVRMAIVYDAPVPRDEAKFKIDSSGIRDVS